MTIFSAFYLPAMETEQTPNTTQSTQVTISQQEFDEKAINFFTKNEITYVDETNASCCGMHNFARLYSMEESVEQLKSVFTDLEIPFSKLDDLFNQLIKHIREIINVVKIDSTAVNKHVIEKDLHEQIPNNNCAYCDKKLLERGAIVTKRKARSINLEKIKNNLIVVACDGEEFTNISFNNNSMIITLKNGKQKIFKHPLLKTQSQLTRNKEIVGHVGAHDGKPAYVLYKDGSAEYFNINYGATQEQLLKVVKFNQNKKKCAFCRQIIDYFDYEGTFCQDHEYCKGCFFAFLEVVSKCDKCQRFDNKESKPKQNITHATNALYRGKEENTNTTTTSSNNKFSTKEKIPLAAKVKIAAEPTVIKGLVESNTLRECIFCYGPRFQFDTRFILCDEHLYCRTCYYQAIAVIEQCAHCKKTTQYSTTTKTSPAIPALAVLPDSVAKNVAGVGLNPAQNDIYFSESDSDVSRDDEELLDEKMGDVALNNADSKSTVLNELLTELIAPPNTPNDGIVTSEPLPLQLQQLEPKEDQ